MVGFVLLDRLDISVHREEVSGPYTDPSEERKRYSPPDFDEKAETLFDTINAIMNTGHLGNL